MQTVGIGYFLARLVQLYMLVVFIWVMSSWFPQFRQNPIIELTGRISEPFLSIFRRIIPPIGGMLDISPILAIVILNLIAGIFAQLRF